MKEHVPFLDTNAMEWKGGEFPGQFTKPLSANADTGARTALQCIDPTRGYQAPTSAHYHPDMDEELLVLKGKFSFDSQNWLGRNSYCFHPGNTVHGFKSAVAEESWFLSRISKPLKFGWEANPKKLEPYSLTGAPVDRPIRICRDVLTEPDWQDVKDADGKVVYQQLILGENASNGEGSKVVRLPAGWKSKHGSHFHSVYEEIFVIEGEVTDAEGRVFRAGCYAFTPAFTVKPALSSAKGASVYVNYGGPLDFVPADQLHRMKKAS